MSTNYETISILATDDVELHDEQRDRLNELENLNGVGAVSIIADANAGPWGVVSLDLDEAAYALRGIPGADVDGGSDEYAEYCERIEAQPYYLGNLQ